MDTMPTGRAAVDEPGASCGCPCAFQHPSQPGVCAIDAPEDRPRCEPCVKAGPKSAKHLVKKGVAA